MIAPFVSIHIVTYNKPKHLANCIQSVLQHPPDYDFEVLVMDNAGNTDIKSSERIQIFKADKNHGFAGALNILASLAGLGKKVDATHFIQTNDDVIFAPYALSDLVDACINDVTLGLACSNLVNGGIYPKDEPAPSDVTSFAERFSSKESLCVGAGASNNPWCIPVPLWHVLSETDVWSDCILPANTLRGALDVGIDPYVGGWCVDWDLHNRIEALGFKVGVVDSSHAYHYDHVTVSELDRTSPGWTQVAVNNYVAKYGVFGKGLPLISKPKPAWWPFRRNANV